MWDFLGEGSSIHGWNGCEHVGLVITTLLPTRSTYLEVIRATSMLLDSTTRQQSQENQHPDDVEIHFTPTGQLHQLPTTAVVYISNSIT